MERKSRKLRWKEFIETPELDDEDEKKAEELQRLITLWRTSDKRREMYKDMENMEVENNKMLSAYLFFIIVVIHMVPLIELLSISGAF